MVVNFFTLNLFSRHHLLRQTYIKRMMASVTKPKIFVTRNSCVIPEKGRALLENKDLELIYWKSDEPPLRQEFLTAVKGIDGLFCVIPDQINAELLDAAGTNLKVVVTMSVGFDHIDVKECKSRGIKIGNTPGVLTHATAELTVGLLLSVSRRLKEGMMAVQNGGWGSWKPTWLCGPGLEGSTVGVVGMGRIGLTVSRCLKPFGVKEILYSGHREKTEASEIGAKFVTFDELLKESDFVIVSCPLTQETKHLFDMSAFKKMKNTAILVNTSRGPVVEQDDLYNALVSGEIAGAGLDVTTPEPLPVTSPLLELQNCVVIPHLGSATIGSRDAMAVLTAKNLIAGLRNEEMPCPL